ncbi:MAG: hypothetical protein SF123_22990 [Chloroflexota bacterium]|nr:hypothetical protein [Chloroflexota bacterium]
MLKERLETTLIGIARRFVPQLAPPYWAQPGDYPRPLPDLVQALANEGILVIMGDVPVPHTGDAQVHVKLWADLYVQLYNVLVNALFPNYGKSEAYYADEEWPPIILVRGNLSPVIKAIALYIAPFITQRQSGTPVNDAEIDSLIDQLLKYLEAGDMPADEYQDLYSDAAALVKDLLAVHVRQMPLLPVTRPLSPLPLPLPPPPAARPPTPTTLPGVPPQPPDDLPETGEHPAIDEPPPPKGSTPLPPIGKSKTGSLRPPVPPIPPRDRDKR